MTSIRHSTKHLLQVLYKKLCIVLVLQLVTADVQIGPIKSKPISFTVVVITASNTDLFSIFFTDTLQQICNQLIIKDPIAPQIRRYTTLWNQVSFWMSIFWRWWYFTTRSGCDGKCFSSLPLMWLVKELWESISIWQGRMKVGAYFLRTSRHIILFAGVKTVNVTTDRSRNDVWDVQRSAGGVDDRVGQYCCCMSAGVVSTWRPQLVLNTCQQSQYLTVTRNQCQSLLQVTHSRLILSVHTEERY